MARAYPFFSPALDTCMFLAAPRCWYCMSLTIPRSVIISGRKTSVRLEPAFWVALQEIADKRFMTLPDLIATIEAERKYQNRIVCTSVVRAGVLSLPGCRPAENQQQHQRSQSSSASRFTAGASGFLNFSQSGDRPDR